MKAIRILLLALPIAAATAMALANPAALDTTATERIIQFQGHAAMPKRLCGYIARVEGLPGTRYAVLVEVPGEESFRIASGVIPSGGSIGIGVSLVDCRRDRSRQRVEVWSHSDAPIRARVSFF